MQQQGNTAPMEHVHEASRRMALMETYANKPLEKPVFSDCIPNLDADRSKRPVLLYNVAQEGCSPTPNDPHNPAMRLLGVFDDAGGCRCFGFRLAVPLVTAGDAFIAVRVFHHLGHFAHRAGGFAHGAQRSRISRRFSTALSRASPTPEQD